jgi:putative tricarboxylic transport membrane protein
MRLSDTFSGLLLLLFGCGVAFHARTFPATPGQNIGPGLFPLLIGMGIAVAGAVLIWSGRRQDERRWLESEMWMRQPRLLFNGALVIGAVIFYALAVETTGFFIAAFVFLGALFLAFGVDRRWVVPIAAGVTLGLHLAFYSLLRVPLPWGWLEGIAW